MAPSRHPERSRGIFLAEVKMVSVRSPWKTGKSVEPSGKNADVQERFLATPLMTIRG